VTLGPTKSGRKPERMADYLADNVALAYRWLTGEQPPRGDPYDHGRGLADSPFYKLGRAAFRAHGLRFLLSRLQAAARRMRLN
jgi:hypothetical protein